MKKKWINLLLFGFITVSCAAQTDGYKFYSKLDSVKTSGFYNVEVTPELSAHVKTDYSDLRIINASNKWVPHVLHAPWYERTSHQAAYDQKFSIIENSKANTVILIESSKNISSNIGLIITNTAAERFCTLSGSNDKENWFVINDSILLNPSASENETENIFSINFPPTSYRFYKVEIHNNNKDPFNIKGVVKYSSPEVRDTLRKLNDNPVVSLQQKDSGKISYIKITQQQPYQFDNISLQLSRVKYYNRKVDLYVPDADNSSFANPGQLLQSFTISNNSTLKFNILLTKSSVLYLLINNEDNLPLTVDSVKTACSNHYITTYLEAGSSYRLIMDNENAVMPNYDLSKLNSKIPDSISFLQFGKITAFTEIKPVVTAAKNNKWILWFAIAAALLILLFFTYKMFKEVDKRETK
jgi:hypothetical protein